MSRWDYDTVFYRVFCITLLAVAFTFTVVLTNVFVDIDGLLSRKDKSQTPKPEMQKLNDIAEIMNVNILPDDKSEDIYDDKDYQDSNDLYRSKRSLETPDFLFHVKHPKLKKILTNRLTLLLDALDEDETSTTTNKDNQNNNDVQVNKVHELNNLIRKQSAATKNSRNHVETIRVDHASIKNNLKEDKKDEIKPSIKSKHDNMEDDDILVVKDNLNTTKRNDEGTKIKKDKNNANDEMEGELLHLAMHNIVLQGIVGNMNLDDVYKKVADLVKKFENDHTNANEEEFHKIFKETKRLKKRQQEIEAEKFTDEPIHFKDLHRETDSGRGVRNNKSEEIIDNRQTTTTTKPRDHSLIIKTIIDITALNNDRSNKDSDNNNKNINGIVKLIYNGKTMKFKRMDDDLININNNNNTNATENANQNNIKIARKNHKIDTSVTNDYFENIIQDYLRGFPEGLDSSEHLVTRKRLKRHIKIRFDGDKTTAKPKPKKTDDDELFVEIETHFDSKGAKGEQKRKMIKELIKKIQKAIHDDKETPRKKSKHWHVKKRVQDPLGKKKADFISKLVFPLTHRHLDPISKAVPLNEDMPLVSDDSGRINWQRKYAGPRFFGKAINSAEMSTVDVDYDKVMRQNGIPQRLQKPLNTDISDEILQNSSLYDLGNVRFLLKDMEGTGFAVGFNQYTDEAPDPETMKLFSGLQNIIKTYHQNYDQLEIPDAQIEQAGNNDERTDLYENNANANEGYDYEKKDSREHHNIERRSIKESQKSHYHSNEYTKMFEHNFMPYNKYVVADPVKTRKARKLQTLKAQQANSLLIVDENIFEKNLKPGEILSIADLIERRKRSMKLKKITNLNLKNKVSRYLNTQTMATKKFFLNKKRNKRQIGKIRIVARDSSHPQRNSQEDIFVVSDEKIFADRAVVREVEVPEIESNDKMHSIDHYDIIAPEKEEDSYDVINPPDKVSDDHYDIVSPYTYDVPHVFDAPTNEFSRRARHNNLMSKYPHIFMEETIKESDTPDTYGYAQYAQLNNQVEATTQVIEPTIYDLTSPNAEEIAQLLSAQNDNKNNYRVTVKIRPKNGTGVSGYKEVHTSINKSFNKNGLMYTSLTNVSQLSKVEKIDKNLTRRDFDNTSLMNVKQQQNIIQSLIKQHKSRIDEQLQQLNNEKDKLEKINIGKLETLHDSFFNSPLSDDGNLRRNKEAIRKLLAVAEPSTTEVSTEATTKPTTRSSTTTMHITTTLPTSPTPTVRYETTTENIYRIKLFDKIERNENLTNAILKKIDQNTGVLQDFLGKLLERIDLTHTTTPHIETKKIDILNEEPIKNHNHNHNRMPEIKTTYDIPFNFDEYNQNIHKTFFRNMPNQMTNNSGIPFLYAYQQPFQMASNKDAPIASVVYHGHIHTNTMNKEAYYKPLKKTTDYQQERNKDTFYKEKKATEYYKQERNKEMYYKTDKKQPEYYKSDNVINVNLVNPKPDIKEVLKENARPVLEEKKHDDEKEFWLAKPGEKVLHNFVMKNSSKFFMDESGPAFKIYTPIGPAAINDTKV